MKYSLLPKASWGRPGKEVYIYPCPHRSSMPDCGSKIRAEAKKKTESMMGTLLFLVHKSGMCQCGMVVGNS